MYRAGMRSIFSQLAREGRLNIVESFSVDAPKTKLLAEKVKAMGLESVLIIADKVEENLYLPSRNLHKVAVVEAQHADPLSLIHFQKVLILKSAVAQIEEMLK
jgi:large subunit ribosomal protein L4